MADASAGDGREDEEPFESPHEDFYFKYIEDFPLEDELENRNLSLGDAETPPAMVAEIISMIEDAGTEAGMFTFNAWHALFRYCRHTGAPDVCDKSDRFLAVAFLRYHFIIKDGNSEELVYENGNTRYIPRTVNKLKTLVPQAQVSAIAMCLL